MKHWGYTEWLRQEAEKVDQQRRPEPPKPTWAPGSLEWLAEQEAAQTNQS